MGALEIAVAAETLALAALALRWFLAAQVHVIREGEYTDGTPRIFIKPVVRSDGTFEGTYLADDRTGRALQFVGVEASQHEMRFAGGAAWANVTCRLKNVPVSYREKRAE